MASKNQGTEDRVAIANESAQGETKTAAQPLATDDSNVGEGVRVGRADGNGKTQGYSNEARAYHARYAYLSSLHDNGHYTECAEGCKDLLTEPRIPLWTRIQTGQMLSTMMSPAVAKHLLEDANHVLDLLNQDDFRTKLLREDNEKMMRDVELSPPDTGREGSVLFPDMCPELGFTGGEAEFDDEEEELSESESSADGDEEL
ncbi:hypothetical protein LTR95_013277 [Oleoguttula sp. CCFEE 5521]